MRKSSERAEAAASTDFMFQFGTESRVFNGGLRAHTKNQAPPVCKLEKLKRLNQISRMSVKNEVLRDDAAISRGGKTLLSIKPRIHG